VTDVLRKSVALLELLAEQDQTLSVQQIALKLGMAKSSAHRLLVSWEELGYVERTQHDRRFKVGLRMLELGRKVSARNGLTAHGRETLVSLHRKFGESVYLALYRAGKVLLIDSIESTNALRVVVDLGETCHLHASATGKAVAAFLPREELDEVLPPGRLPKLTPTTTTDRRRLYQALDAIRASGIAVNREDTTPGVICLGAPLFLGEAGRVLGALGISIPVCRASEPLLDRVKDALLDSARALSRKLAETRSVAADAAGTRRPYQPRIRDRAQAAGSIRRAAATA
jgi:IclR family acetate operon transcriptional repressor